MWLPYPTSMGKSQPTYTKNSSSKKTKTEIARESYF